MAVVPDSTVTVPESEALRVVYDFLNDCGFAGAASALQRESGISCRTLSRAEADELRRLVESGEWDGVLEYVGHSYNGTKQPTTPPPELLLSDEAHFALWEAIVSDLFFIGTPSHARLMEAAKAPGSVVVVRGWAVAGVDPRQAREHADDLLLNNPVLLELKRRHVGRYRQLAERARTPEALVVDLGAVPAWRAAAWAAIRAELRVDATEDSGDAGASQADRAAALARWAPLLLTTAAANASTIASDRRRPRDDGGTDDGADERRWAAAAAHAAASGGGGAARDGEAASDGASAAAGRELGVLEGSKEGAPIAIAGLPSDVRPTAIMAVPRRGLLLIGGDDGSIRLLRRRGGAATCVEFQAANATASMVLSFAVTGTHAVAGHRDGSLTALDVTSSGGALSWRNTDTHQRGVAAVAFVGEDCVVAGAHDGTISVHDSATGQRMKTMRSPSGAEVTCIAATTVATETGNTFVCGDSAGVLRCFRASGPSDQPVWTVSAPDGTAAVVAVATGKALDSATRVRTDVMYVAFSDATVFAVSIADGQRLQELKPAKAGSSGSAPVLAQENATHLLTRADDGSLASVVTMQPNGSAFLLRPSTNPSRAGDLDVAWSKSLLLECAGGSAAASGAPAGRGAIALLCPAHDGDVTRVAAVFKKTVHTLR